VDAQGHGIISAKIASTVHDTFHALMLAELDQRGKATPDLFEKLNLRLAQSVTAQLPSRYGKFAPYLVAQIAGCVRRRDSRLASFSAAWEETPDQSLKLACFCTAPAIRRFSANLVREIVGTLILVLVVGAIFSKAVADSGPASGLGPYLVAALVWGIGLSLGGTTGYAINPARDFGPRLAHAVLPIAG
jgi:glycerol uptake facilitator protein